jgi:GTP-binding protein
MGTQFLRHIQRTRILVYLLDITSREPALDLEILKQEMESFDKLLVKKPSITAFNKIDLVSERPVEVENFGGAHNSACYISAVTGENIDILLESLSRLLFKDD